LETNPACLWLDGWCVQEFNATVEFYWAPFLVESNSDDPKIHSIQHRIIKADEIAKHAENWRGVDYLIFNTYIWWMNTLNMKVMCVLHVFYSSSSACSSRAQPAGRTNESSESDANFVCLLDSLGRRPGGQSWEDHDELVRSEAYRRVLTTWAGWVNQNVDPARTSVFFMSMSPLHIRHVLVLPTGPSIVFFSCCSFPS
jgi:hypothetical protein